jgi:hypothetical protein
MYQKSKTSIKFSYNHEGYTNEHYSLPKTNLECEIDGECNISEICNVFENFLLGCGYRLNQGESIGIVEK